MFCFFNGVELGPDKRGIFIGSLLFSLFFINIVKYLGQSRVIITMILYKIKLFKYLTWGQSAGQISTGESSIGKQNLKRIIVVTDIKGVS